MMMGRQVRARRDGCGCTVCVDDDDDSAMLGGVVRQVRRVVR